jgi:hypothetical protein
LRQQYVVELEEFDYNPIDRISWKPVEVAEAVAPAWSSTPSRRANS